MHGLMMDAPLVTTALIQHAARHHARTQIVSRQLDGSLHRYSYADAYQRIQQLAGALQDLGIARGDRVATLAINSHRHFELYFGVPGIGAVCHTINPRLHPDQLVFIINEADDRLVCFDPCFAQLVKLIADRCPRVLGWICLSATASEPGDARALAYEPLLAAQPPAFDWPELDERDASSLCYTSGTTGNPKGVLYSHRTTVLHAMAICWPDSLDLHASDAMCPIVPMFHVNAWGLPYSACISGCKLVFAGAALDGASVFGLFEDEQVNLSAGVPTVWLGLLNYVESKGLKFSTLKNVVFGGAPMAMALYERFQTLGVDSLHAWGMTEMSPLGSSNRETFVHRSWNESARKRLKLKQGRAPFGVDLRVVGADGAELPWDGKSVGNLQVRGLWVLKQYFAYDASPLTADGWFDTGDIASLDENGFIQITDRAKDVIKSGGEWISSIDLENTAMSYPGVAEAAAIAIPDAKWDERPALVVVARPGVQLDSADLLCFFEGKVAKWWIPDTVFIVDELPHNATGKVQKLLLREKFSKG